MGILVSDEHVPIINLGIASLGVVLRRVYELTEGAEQYPRLRLLLLINTILTGIGSPNY